MVRARQVVVDVPTTLIAADSLLLRPLKLCFKEPARVSSAGLAGLLLRIGG